MRFSFYSYIVSVALCLAASPARADAIDGAWCSPAGERVTINGEEVITPGGKTVKGTYTRHTMSFTIPEGEPGAGNKLYMEQLHEGAVKVTTIKEVQVEPGAHEDWQRCPSELS